MLMCVGRNASSGAGPVLNRDANGKPTGFAPGGAARLLISAMARAKGRTPPENYQIRRTVGAGSVSGATGVTGG